MKIGLSTATFFGKSKTEDSFELIRYCGCDIAEVFLTTFSEYEKDFGYILKDRIGGVEVHSIHTLNSQFEPQLYNDIERTYLDAETVFRRSLSVGNMLGAKFYTFHGPARLKRACEYKFNYEKLGKVTSKLIDIAEEYGISLSFENVHWAYYYFAGFYSNLKKYAPKLKGTLDIKQAYQSGEDYKKFIKDMGKDISTIHVCDYQSGGKLCPIGRGDFNFKELFTVLSDYGVDAPVMVELYSGDYASFDDVKDSVQFLRQF